MDSKVPEKNDDSRYPGGPGPGRSFKMPEKTDPLTGLNYVAWFFAQTQMNPSFYPLEKATIVFFNVMNFKAINQRYSYQGGNEYLCRFAEETKRAFEGEVIARAGADHLVVISQNLSVDDIVKRVEDLNKIMASFEKGLRNQIKAGIYVSDGQKAKPILMMDRASIACNEVRGIYNKNYAVFDDAFKIKHEQKQYVLEHFDEAFEKGYFKVFYQPVVRALTGKVCGYEALARWFSPDRGMISPLIFIEVLEKVHLIHRLDALIIEQACKDLRDDIDSGFAYQPISVNLSRLDFELSDIKKIVDDAVAKYNVPKEYLVLEVTESAFSSDLSNLGDVIHSFRKDGYQVWIDDFGSGYSSFNNLQTYDFDFLKIDMNFMRNFDKNPKSKVIIASIVDMAKRLGIHTLAEGVETKEQYEFLRNIGCELIQGYYFAKPTPLEEFQKNRSDLCSFETNESPEERVYYDNIGKVNFLDSTPLRDNPLDVASFVPIAILEQSGRTYTDIYINEPYMKVIESFGAKNFADALKFARTGNSRDHLNKVYEQLKYSEKTGKPITFNLILNGKKINCRARFIGRFGEKAAYTFISRNISYYEEM